VTLNLGQRSARDEGRGQVKKIKLLVSSKSLAILAYRAILRREAEPSEIGALARSSFKGDGFFHLLRDMVGED
jgi:hypothetical protein